METILLGYLLSIPVWILLLHTWQTLISIGKEGILKLMYSIGEKTVFSGVALLANGLYDVIFGKPYDLIFVSMSLPLIAAGVYLVKLTQIKKGD